MNKFPLFLSAADIERALSMDEAIEAMRAAFIELDSGQVTLPVRTCISDTEQNGVDLVMSCYSSRLKRYSVKTVTVFSENRERNLPTTQGLLILTDGENGSHLAVMDGSSLTAIRTGAASGLATDLMSRSDSTRVGIIGAGTQACTQLEAVCCVRQVKRVSVFSLRRSSAERFASEMSKKLGVEIVVADSSMAALSEADIVCTATPSLEPVFRDEEIQPGVHINAVGAYREDMSEVPPSVVRRASVVVDHLESALEEAGDLLKPLNDAVVPQTHFETELGCLASGKTSGRTDDQAITLFKSVGVAIQDLYAANQAFENAKKLGLGKPLV